MSLGKPFYECFKRIVVITGRAANDAGKAIAANQSKRISGQWRWYADLYGKNKLFHGTFCFLINGIKNSPRLRVFVQNRLRMNFRSKIAFGTFFTGFKISWDQHKISTDDIETIYCQKEAELKAVSNACDDLMNSTDETNFNYVPWQKLLESDHMALHARHSRRDNVYECQVFGSVKDISAQSFFEAQVNHNYRKQWDTSILELDVLAIDHETGSELVRWVHKYPYPMRSREYIYVRRHQISNDRIVSVSRSVDLDRSILPENSNHVRISHYSSVLILKPHLSADQVGFDFLLVYNDDPKTVIPQTLYTYGSTRGTIDFLKRLTSAASKLSYEEPGTSYALSKQTDVPSWVWPTQQQNTA